MLMFEREFSFAAAVGLGSETVLPVIIRTSIPLRPRADRWWGAFGLERGLASKLQDGDEVVIIDQNGSKHPALIVGRQGEEVSFRCRSAFPVPASTDRDSPDHN
jgi:hypothetical protein